MKFKKMEMWIQKGIVAVLALFSLLTLCFPLISVINVVSVHGFDFLSFATNSFGTEFAEIEIGYGICSICLLILGITAVVFAVLNFVLVKKTKIFNIVIIATALFSSIFYFIEGFVLKNDILNLVGYYYGYGYGYNYSQYISTACFVPFIICAVLVIAYFVVMVVFNNLAKNEAKIPNKAKLVANNKPNTRKVVEKKSDNDEEAKIALLTKYKKLLDAGVITQEDFDVKKKQLLGL